MCQACYEEAGSPAIVTDKTREVAALISKVYDFHSAGGNAHIVIDDWNLDDESISWCLDKGLSKNLAESGPDELATERAMLEAMLACSPDERASALAINEGFLACP